MTYRRYWPILLFSFLFVLLGIRLVWTLSVSQTGWSPHLESWVSTPLEILGRASRPLAEQPPSKQAEYWLKEVERIDIERDPQIAEGAAWMLDAPDTSFIKHDILERDDLSDFPLEPQFAHMRREIDQETVRRLCEEYESRCGEKCLAIIEAAVKLSPEDVELRRTQALLLFRSEYLSMELKARSDNWLDILDECARIDSQNALYDYLVAMELWSSSANYKYDSDLDGYVLQINNQEMLARGNERLKVGLSKPNLKFGTEGYIATLAFLDKTDLSKPECLEIAENRLIVAKAVRILVGIQRWQRVQLDEHQRQGEIEKSYANAQTMITIVNQVSEEGNLPYYSFESLVLRIWSLANQTDLIEDHPDLLSKEETARIEANHADAQLELKVMTEMGERVEEADRRRGSANPRSWISSFASEMTQSMLLVTISIVLIFAIVGRVFRDSEAWQRSRLRWGRHCLCWIVGTGICYVLFGMLPAKLISPAWQTWIITAIIWIGFVTLLGGLFYWLSKLIRCPGGQFVILVAVTFAPLIVVLNKESLVKALVMQFATLPPLVSIVGIFAVLGVLILGVREVLQFVRETNISRGRKWLIVGCVCLISCATVFVSVSVYVLTSELPKKAWVSPAISKEMQSMYLGVDEIQSKLKLEDSPWLWSILQAEMYQAHLIAILLSAGLIFFWQLVRRGKKNEEDESERNDSRKLRQRLHDASTAVLRSCLIASALFSLIYLAAIPDVSRLMDRQYSEKYQRLVDPSYLHEKIDGITEEIENDQRLMKQFQQEIDEQNREIAEREAFENEAEE